MPELFGLILLFEDTAQPGPGSGLISFAPFLIIIVVFYFLVIRPQNKERKRVEQETKEMLAALKNGDKIVTTSGILGTVMAVRDDTVQLRIADGVKIDILRSSIARKQGEPAQASEAKS